MFLVDTNTISDAHRRDQTSGPAREWLMSVSAESVHLSAITDYELEIGVLRLERRDPRQALPLRRWLSELRSDLGERVLPVSPEIARVCASINVPDPRPWADSLIAATALHHGLTVVTRNVRDFVVPGLKVLNPFSE